MAIIAAVRLGLAPLAGSPQAFDRSDEFERRPFDDVAGDRVDRLTRGSPTTADINWLCTGFRAWSAAEGAVQLERILRLPRTRAERMRMSRDRWLCVAARHVTAQTDWESANELADVWNVFVTRGPWLGWRDDADPPSYASERSRALFYASKANRGRTLAARQLLRIVAHVFAAKSTN